MRIFMALLLFTPVLSLADAAPDPDLSGCPNRAHIDGTLADEFFDALPVKARETKEGEVVIVVKEIKTARGTQLICTQLRDKSGKPIEYFHGMKPNCVLTPAASKLPTDFKRGMGKILGPEEPKKENRAQ